MFNQTDMLDFFVDARVEACGADELVIARDSIGKAGAAVRLTGLAEVEELMEISCRQVTQTKRFLA